VDPTPIVLYSLFFGFITAYLAAKKRHGVRSWFFLGVIFGAIATFLLYLQPDKSSGDVSTPPPE
jgi:hypothetical protein